MMGEYGAAISEHPDPAHAVGEVAGVVLEAVGPAPDVAVLFVTGHHIAAVDDISAAVGAVLQPGVLVGTSAVSVIGGPVEVEEEPAISLWAGRVGPCESVRLEVLRGSEGVAIAGMPEDAATEPHTLLLLTEPFTFPADALVAATRVQYPELRVVGGMASAGGPGENRLVLDGAIHHHGAVGVLLPTGVGSTTVVSQGCRPVGDPFIVTECEGNTIVELASRPALERLGELIDAAGEKERELLARGLHVGIVIDESKPEFSRGDFLIRAVMGVDHEAGTLRIGDRVPVGTTLQFHVRDATAADEDLRSMLAGRSASSALVFTCNGRGAHLFGAPNHDAELVADVVAGGPVAGMFCAGEMGPVAGANHVHGFTASIVLFDD